LGTNHFLVPLAGAEFQDGEDPAIRVPYSKERVQDAPDVEGDWISEEEERRLYNYACRRRSAALRPNSLRVGPRSRISTP
jgi:hypothetical protein